MEKKNERMRKKQDLHFITLYLTQEEFAWLNKQCAAALTSKCGYVRQRIFTGRFPRMKVDMEEAQLYRRLREMNTYLMLLPEKIDDPLSLAVLEEQLMEIRKHLTDIIQKLICDSDH